MEEMILLAVLNLQGEAYLVAITDYLSEITSKKVSLTSVHLPLSRLEKQGLIESALGKATAIRGGRRKKIYKITRRGFAELNEYRRISDKLWINYSKLSMR
jgi:DNA-binding PadR family transcriptional regulator